MTELYPHIRLLHIDTVILSGVLFLLRGIGVQSGQRWPMFAPVRYLTYAIDTVLLTAAILLTIILRQYPFVQPWLTVKVVLLIVYIVLGSFALKRGQTAHIRLVCFLTALLVYGYIITVARAHHPAGIFLWLGR
jgi:uncharacterized membrane protein SirB2